MNADRFNQLTSIDSAQFKNKSKIMGFTIQLKLAFLCTEQSNKLVVDKTIWTTSLFFRAAVPNLFTDGMA